MSISLKFVNFAHENHFIFIFCGKELIIFAPVFFVQKKNSYLIAMLVTIIRKFSPTMHNWRGEIILKSYRS